MKMEGFMLFIVITNFIEYIFHSLIVNVIVKRTIKSITASFG